MISIELIAIWQKEMTSELKGGLSGSTADFQDGRFTLEAARRLDLKDDLAPLRERFILPPNTIYLDGNSLGALPRGVAERMKYAIEQEWGHGLIGSWTQADWYPAPLRVGATIAGLIGAKPHEVVVCDSTSVNLFKVLIAALRLRPGRKILLCEEGNFPTDVYIAAGVAKLLKVEIVFAEAMDIPAAIALAGDQLAVVQLTQVNYKTGALYDMAAITALTHQYGGLSIWDLAHSAGVLPLALEEAGADFAVGCGYKYLNGGPGAPAFVYVRQEHLPEIVQPLQGWHGHQQPFEFAEDYVAHPGIDQMLVGTAPQLSLIAFEVALKAYAGVDMQQVRKKSMALGDLFIRLIDEQLQGFDLEITSPRDARERGSQVSLRHPQGYAIVQALIARGVVGDFRAPDILRFGFAPLYVCFEDIWHAVSTLASIMQEGAWQRPEFLVRKAVT